MSNSPCVIDCKQLFIPIHSIPAKQNRKGGDVTIPIIQCHVTIFGIYTLSNSCDVSDCVE